MNLPKQSDYKKRLIKEQNKRDLKLLIAVIISAIVLVSLITVVDGELNKIITI